jgi:hypothetical protein
MKRILVALIILGIASMTIGGTFADFSDMEVSPNNFVQTGNIDLKVVKCGDCWHALPGEEFTDDEPWGTGLGYCFDITELQECPKPCDCGGGCDYGGGCDCDPGCDCNRVYRCNLKVWNAGSHPGSSYVHLKIIEDSASVARKTHVKISYDINNDGDFKDPGETIEGRLADLACHHIPAEPTVWPLEENAVHRLSIEVYFDRICSKTFTLKFDTEFILLSGFYSDTEKCHNSFTRAEPELGGTPCFWGSCWAIMEYGKCNLVTWFREIVADSEWFADVTITGNLNVDYWTMWVILQDGGWGYLGAVNQFRAQYLATRLNTMPDSPRLGLGTVHDITSIPGASSYFDYDSGTLEQIVDTIESKAEGGIFTAPPSKYNILIMKNICDALNQVKI